VGARRGAAVGLGEDGGGGAVRFDGQRLELQHFEGVRPGGGEVGLEAGDAAGGAVPRGGRGVGAGGGEVGVGVGDAVGGGVALGAEQQQLGAGALGDAGRAGRGT